MYIKFLKEDLFSDISELLSLSYDSSWVDSFYSKLLVVQSKHTIQSFTLFSVLNNALGVSENLRLTLRNKCDFKLLEIWESKKDS